MSKLTIDEMLEIKEKAQRDILKIALDFREKTDCSVIGIHLHTENVSTIAGRSSSRRLPVWVELDIILV